MPTQSIDQLRALIGQSVQTVEDFAIERGKVAEFARAVKDPCPLFHDADAAAAAGYPAIVAPPTFTRVAYYPHNRADDGEPNFGFDLGFDRSRTVHGEQEYEYARPVYVGDELSGTTTLTDVYERDGSDGTTLTFAVLETVYRTESDERVVTERRTRIEIDEDSPDSSQEFDVEIGESTVEPSGELTVTWDGNCPTMAVPRLSELDFVRYAGASGDFNPIHVSESAARATGVPTVFGHGMLTMALAGRFVREWVDISDLSRFRTRFRSRVWPGDELRIDGDRSSREISYRIRNQREGIVATGDATVR